MTRGNSTSVPAKLSENAQCSAQQRLGRGEGGKGVSQSVGELSVDTRSLRLTWFPGLCDRFKLAQFRTRLVSLAAEERGNTGKQKDGGVLCSAIVSAIS